MLVTVARYSFPWQAHIDRARLEAEGIPAFVADEQTINMQWLYSDALGGVRLQVPSSWAEQAAVSLAQDHSLELSQSPGEAEAVCPECGGALQLRQRGRRRAFLVFLGVDFPLFPVRKVMYCPQCGYEAPYSRLGVTKED